MESALQNIKAMLTSSSSPVVEQSIQELVAAAAWGELNDRFYRTLAFGTGGLRGRTIGRIVTAAEQGAPQPLDRPEFPCVGTNAMNDFNVSRATQGLANYCKKWFQQNGLPGRPTIVIAHDTRHFSRHFAELAARVAVELGCNAGLFAGPRSTPELSFAVRLTGATAGVVITASHNPPHDNGYKVYFHDGAQVVEPHASGIIAEVTACASDAFTPVPEQGTLITLGCEVDEAYMARLETLVLDRPLLENTRGLKVVFTSIHGTGGVIVKPLFDRLGIRYATVPEQEQFDGRFPTVKSPNPENAEALAKAIELATKEAADLVIATDPDCDRMGVAVRNRHGAMELLSGNQIGSLIAAYRVEKLFASGVLHAGNKERAVIIKTFVTTDLQKAIAEQHGIRCVETLTGFKYIGEKLGKYEAALPDTVRAGYRTLSEDETRTARLASSSYYVAGGEESYGYSAHDFVRDKDGNAAALLFTEVAAHAKQRGITVDQLLDEVFVKYGFYLEKNGNLTFEGADGAAKIGRLVQSYAAQPPAEILGHTVTRVRNFAEETIHDIEGDLLPKEKMLMIELGTAARIAVRPSGTEPKIKFYMFARETATAEQLPDVKERVTGLLNALWDWVQADVERRLAV
jgi:phosphoglucomutase